MFIPEISADERFLAAALVSAQTAAAALVKRETKYIADIQIR